ncbi:MAG: alanine--glyoxylate aminotransferase family protein, partial [Candidatus Heimdallarchaeota archaeon]|nr:alanine--glyoxylate aminotransferase family protein [Candidatus Heimdallarchaeota archaeon]MCK4878697.1 alanine--glyoxylate aminotransferase family protein [Candidatus Heimdallarchaeota archaeon]
HAECHNKLKAGLDELGLKMYVEDRFRLPMLNAVSIPEGIDEAEVRKKLRFEHNIEIGGGLGPLAGKIWRIGVMGHTAQPENIERFLSALKSVL